MLSLCYLINWMKDKHVVDILEVNVSGKLYFVKHRVNQQRFITLILQSADQTVVPYVLVSAASI